MCVVCCVDVVLSLSLSLSLPVFMYLLSTVLSLIATIDIRYIIDYK